MRKSSRRRHKPHSHHGVISQKQREFYKLDNTRDLDQLIETNKVVQDLLGFSRENVSNLYVQAIGFLQVNRVDDALQAFQLLTKLNPYVADFWLGLGIANMHHEEYERSLDAFLVAVSMDPSRIDIYSYAVDCCIEMKHYIQAEGLIDEIEAYARRHHRAEDSKLILHEAAVLRQKIDSYKT